MLDDIPKKLKNMAALKPATAGRPFSIPLF